MTTRGSGKPTRLALRMDDLCPKAIAGTDRPPHTMAPYGGLACMRLAGHAGECIPGVFDAQAADDADASDSGGWKP